MTWRVSDWVSGRTVDDEMVYGFIEAIDWMQGFITLFVVRSDNEERIGRTAAVRLSSVKKVPDAAPQDSRHIPDLIDLALATWDEAWFRELTEGMGPTGQPVSQTKSHTALRTAHANRLNHYLR
ncbi:hypothetical protein D3P08_21170 [Paenibacillus nanensis]|uniref:IDEAL domain-containing protein n=1 Tax=Paenibacillus nanensis TaxID=393251 RepID=A0A3A1UNC3_9BACL|nr:hypothetical protein [Paenibacillus nanensis]RIX50067.1 hypothetical protein D3P08_21170 [Paenibacillus nanensis]